MNTPTNSTRLKAAAVPHAENWLHATLITAVGLRLSNEVTHTVVVSVWKSERSNHVVVYAAR